MSIEDLKYNSITKTIIGCAMKVHQKMKNGHLEAVYHKCLLIEFKRADLFVESEVEMPIYYEEFIVGRRRVDFLVEKNIIVEIKAVTELTDQHLAQALNYLETHNFEVGLLVNFGSKSLQFKRLINQHKLNPTTNQKNPANPNQNPINPRS